MAALPETVRVKLSPEDVGAISVAQVVVRDLPLRELVELMLGVAGKNVPRLHEILRRGTLVSGASRFRWEGWEADPEGLRALLETLPDPEPQRKFAAQRCVRAVLKSQGRTVDIPKQVGEARTILKRASFWSVLMELTGELAVRYVDYSYRERVDCYSAVTTREAVDAIRKAAKLVKYPGLRAQIAESPVEMIEFYATR